MATRFHRGESDDKDFNVFGLNVASIGADPGDGKGTLVAWDPVARKTRWRMPLDTLWKPRSEPFDNISAPAREPNGEVSLSCRAAAALDYDDGPR